MIILIMADRIFLHIPFLITTQIHLMTHYIMEMEFLVYIQIHQSREVSMLVAHYLYIAVISGYYKRRDWQAWADRIILNNDNDDLETWIYDVSIAQNEEQLYEAICDKKRIEYFDEDSKYSQSDIVVGYYCLLFQEKRISIEELTSKLLDEDDNASDAEILKDKKVIRLIEKIFSKIYSLDNIKELMRILYPLLEKALIQQRQLKEYLM